MEMGTVLAIVSGGLAIGQTLPYVRSMLHGYTKPSRIACAISLACNLLLILSLVTSGNTSGLVLPAVFAVSGTIVFVLSIKHGVSGVTATDIVAAAIAAIAITAWLVLGTNAAVIGTNTAQVTALIATFNKLRKNPGTEDIIAWVMGGGAALLSLIAVLISGQAALTLASLALPIRCVLSCVVILALTYVQSHANRQPVAIGHHSIRESAAIAWSHIQHLQFAKAHHFGLAA